MKQETKQDAVAIGVGVVLPINGVFKLVVFVHYALKFW